MAKPRVFISSTHYDLKNIRFDMKRFIADQGYESVLSEKGQIPYSTEENLEEYCYREVGNCDIVLSIIGGRFGSESRSSDENYSISNKELETAFKLNKQVYIFIEKSVLSEFRTYQANPENESITYAFVDDTRVFKFIDHVSSRQINNQIAPFETTSDITDYLREQWAGLFQSHLKAAARQNELIYIEKLRSTADTLNQLVNYLKEGLNDGDTAIKEILLSNHPIFADLQRTLGLTYRIVFSDHSEMSDLLVAHKFKRIGQTHKVYQKEYDTWQDPLSEKKFLMIDRGIFDSEGKLQPTTYANRDNDFLIHFDVSSSIDDFSPNHKVPQSFDDFDDDIPF